MKCVCVWGGATAHETTRLKFSLSIVHLQPRKKIAQVKNVLVTLVQTVELASEVGVGKPVSKPHG